MFRSQSEDSSIFFTDVKLFNSKLRENVPIKSDKNKVANALVKRSIKKMFGNYF